jgi:hypothetical protein
MYMPRSIQEILDHADELARRFEEYEPDPGDEEPVAEYLLRRAALERARGERHIVEAVVAAREEGLSWARIGECWERRRKRLSSGTGLSRAVSRRRKPGWSIESAKGGGLESPATDDSQCGELRPWVALRRVGDP